MQCRQGAKSAGEIEATAAGEDPLVDLARSCVPGRNPAVRLRGTTSGSGNGPGSGIDRADPHPPRTADRVSATRTTAGCTTAPAICSPSVGDDRSRRSVTKPTRLEVGVCTRRSKQGVTTAAIVEWADRGEGLERDRHQITIRTGENRVHPTYPLRKGFIVDVLALHRDR